MNENLIYEWFKKRGIEMEIIVENQDANYLELGFVDSFGFLELITLCEEKFGISFTDDDFTDDSIFSIAGLINIVNRRIDDGK